MQQTSSFESAFRFTLPPLPRPARGWWVAPALVAFGALIGFGLGMDQHASAPAAFAASATNFAAAAPYVSSDPSVPSADSVKFTEAEPQPETF